MRTLWTCYSFRALVLVVPVTIGFALAEPIGPPSPALATGGLARGALFVSFRQPRDLWAGAGRPRPCAGLVTSSCGRTKREAAPACGRWYARLERGHELAWAAARGAADGSADDGQALDGAMPGPGAGPEAALSLAASQGAAAVPSAGEAGTTPGFPGLAPVPTGPVLDRPSRLVPATVARHLRSQLTWRTTVLVAAAVVLVVLIGARNVLTQPLPLVGQLPSPSGGVGGWWHTWWDGAGAGALGALPSLPLVCC